MCEAKLNKVQYVNNTPEFHERASDSRGAQTLLIAAAFTNTSQMSIEFYLFLFGAELSELLRTQFWDILIASLQFRQKYVQMCIHDMTMTQKKSSKFTAKIASLQFRL
jgi:hypothetical protein